MKSIRSLLTSKSLIYIALISLFFLPALSQAQEAENKRLIHVRGQASSFHRPDEATLTMMLSATNKDYTKSINELNKKTDEVRKALIEQGFKSKEIKTLKFSVQKAYEYTGPGRQREFKGFQCAHQLQLKMPAEKKALNNSLTAISKSLSEAEFSIHFGIKDEEPIRKELLKKAVDDAREKADIIARAAKANLKEVHRINYNGPNRQPYDVRVDMDMAFESAARADTRSFKELEPAEIEVSTQIDLSWVIE